MAATPQELSRDDLIAKLAKSGTRVTPAQLLRWTDAGLVPRPRRRGLGRGRGVVALYPATAALQVLLLARLLKRKRNLDDAGWALWIIGFPLTGYVRELLLEEWHDQEKRLKASLRDLGRKRFRQRIIEGPRRHRLSEVSGMLKTVAPDRVPDVFRMFMELQLGTLHERRHSDDEWSLLQDATISTLWPEILDDPDLPGVREIESGLNRQSREMPLSRLIAVLKRTDDVTLCRVRDEIQGLHTALFQASGMPDAIVTRGDFRTYFARRVVDPQGKDEWERIRTAMGWTRPPLNILQTFALRRRAQMRQGDHGDK